MLTLCLRYTKSEEDAVEVLNTGFFKVFKNIHQYNAGQSNIYTWLRTVIINCCIDFVKTKAKFEQYTNLEEAATVSFPAEIINNIKAAELLALIRLLPPATQAVFNLYVIEGYNHKETAKLLGISEGTSKWHLSEAKKSLQQMIKKQEKSVYG